MSEAILVPYREPYEQIIRCEPCKAKFKITGRREIKFCPYCGQLGAKVE